MNRLVYILILLFSAVKLLAQQIKTDTIDYSIIKLNGMGWSLYKVIDGKTERTNFNPNTDFMGFCPVSEFNLVNITKNTKIQINETDTIMYEQWDLDDVKQQLEWHRLARVKFNKTNNIILTEKFALHKLQMKPFIGKFKILKLTKSEVILLDLGNIQKFRRIYYFKA